MIKFINSLSKHVSLMLILVITTCASIPKGKLQPTQPKLVLVIVIDQFRADYLSRFKSRFLAAQDKSGKIGGFNYLVAKGAFYPAAQYSLLQNMTGPGHATILTGANPYRSGIPLNYWYDSTALKAIYCVADPQSSIVGLSSLVRSKQGFSPRNLNSTTLGDELKNAGYPSKVISIALKDRAAILLGGHRADLALWFDKKAFQWVTSSYYHKREAFPAWVKQLNQTIDGQRGRSLIFKSTGKPTGFSLANVPVNDKPNAWKTLGRNFPHKLKVGQANAVKMPYGLEITLEAAKQAIHAYKLGESTTPDLLAISFSSFDYMGHAFSPNSLEMEEMTIIMDNILSQLLNYVNQRIEGGLSHVLVALTADHGVSPSPEWLQQQKIAAGRIDGEMIKNKAERRLTELLGKPKQGKWIPYHNAFNFYLNHQLIEPNSKTQKIAENIIKNVLREEKKFIHIFSRTDYIARRLPPGLFERQILNTYIIDKSGDVVGIPQPFHIAADNNITNHLSGYVYDRTIPIIFSGPQVRPGIYAHAADAKDIAPTLAFFLKILAPSMSEGRVLVEALK